MMVSSLWIVADVAACSASIQAIDIAYFFIKQSLRRIVVPRGGIEPPTLRFSGSFFVNEISKIEN
jgi:3-oxoacyl-(acyl-carrier-protein) synthase